MRKKYDLKLENFYKMYPDLKPVKTEKTTKSTANKNNMVRAAEPEKPVILLPGAPQKPGKPFDLYFQQSDTEWSVVFKCRLALLCLL